MFPARLKARLQASVASRGPHQYRFRPVSRLHARFKSPGTRRGPEEPCFYRFRPVSKLQGPAVGPKNQKVFPEPGPRFIMLSSVMSAESQSPVGTPRAGQLANALQNSQGRPLGLGGADVVVIVDSQ